MSQTSIKTFRQLRDQAAADLSSGLEAELLLAQAVDQSRTWLYARLDETPCPSTVARFAALLTRRRAGEPIAYIRGQREFYGREFRVDPSVLIPRPETELLVDLALELRGAERAAVADIGTGSGCIALTLAAERPDWLVTASDISDDALRVAESNGRALGLSNVSFVQSDLLAALPGGLPFDLIVSNPPYVAEHDSHLRQGDLRFEPSIALSCAGQGLAIIRRLAVDAVDYLQSGGWLLIEHGYDQAVSVASILKQQSYSDVKTHCDLGGVERVTLGRRPGS